MLVMRPSSRSSTTTGSLLVRRVCSSLSIVGRQDGGVQTVSQAVGGISRSHQQPPTGKRRKRRSGSLTTNAPAQRVEFFSVFCGQSGHLKGTSSRQQKGG